MLLPARDTIFRKAYRYGFNGKELDTNITSQDYNYGARIYHARIVRFLSVDPITKKYPWYTPYQFAGNSFIWETDLDGLEESQSTIKGLSFFPILTPINSKTAGQMMMQQFSRSGQAFQNSRTGRFINGGVTTFTGLVGTIGSIDYIAESGGMGAALGGTVALQFSLSQTSIGIAQMVNAFVGEPNKALNRSSNLPGLIAYGMDSKYAPAIDAVGALIPSITMSGGGKSFLNLNGFVHDGFGVVSLATNLWNTPSIRTAVEFLDQLHSVIGVGVESFKLFSDKIDANHLIQKLDYTLDYTVQSGDDLTSIAKRLNTSVDELSKQNKIAHPDDIKAGQKLKFHNVVYGKGSSEDSGSN